MGGGALASSPPFNGVGIQPKNLGCKGVVVFKTAYFHRLDVRKVCRKVRRTFGRFGFVGGGRRGW